ncbi:hypothetical protein CBM2633_P30008 [Cupriavidus taiwanensis]|uniref:Uncharacterized protein n=2 Tax=Cupriavidus TaxID=106589 RepID=A0A375CNK8_9BURK|nr:hypothetical protein CBM2588_P30008 [Cupriavidus taiwanensis]SOZ40578.1 hypothetical protein CBM2605_P30008 [Cupriavidus neocaledonicus]SOY75421.1 hypothetical protein CBM2592_P30008 [Cupriavidus taiwanensis]SOY75745.1 hypothetical protein CBM2585_P30008 [Cupriavidus taiwanensis]SOY76281.1 hypothetical protein CBM2589_P30008 [Cupriavidus taiwanensis]
MPFTPLPRHLAWRPDPARLNAAPCCAVKPNEPSFHAPLPPKRHPSVRTRTFPACTKVEPAAAGD